MTLKTDIDQIAVDAGKLHDIVHGGPTAVVATDGGTVKSVAKAIADLEAQIVTDAGSYLDQCQDEVALATAQAQTATNQAAAAAGSALSAASVVAQDLSAIDRTVFASVTLISAFLYDTSRDSDGGAWRHRCAHTSWYNETLSGNWLGSAANEAGARAISGAATGSYYYDTTAKVFYKLNAGSGVTQVYRGNAAKFPAKVLITLEGNGGSGATSRKVIWDLTQAGCPMWMVFTGAAGNMWYFETAHYLKIGAVMRDGLLATHGVYFGRTNFVTDNALLTVGTSAYRYPAGISGRNSAAGYLAAAFVYGTTLAGSATYDAAITVLPNAPVDAGTRLPVPTIAVATAGGVSLFLHDGTIANLTNSAGATTYYPSRVAFKKNRRVAYNVNATGQNRVDIGPIPSVSASGNPVAGFNSLSIASTPAILPSNAGSGIARLIVETKHALAMAVSESALALFAENETTLASSMVANITKDYTSGWMPGAIKGAWLAGIVAETLTGAELITNGDFATDSSASWLNVGNAQNITAAAGALRFESTGGSSIVLRSASSNAVVANLVNGKTYTLSAKLTQTVGAGGATYQLRVYNNAASVLLGSASITTVTGVSQKVSITFTATENNYPLLYPWVTTATALADAFELDDLSIRLADVDRSIKAKGVQAFGSITKAAVASGAQLVGYSGWSVANYFEQPVNPDLDFGTGDFCYLAWVKPTADGTVQQIFNRGAYAGSFSGSMLSLYMDGTCRVFAYLSDDGAATYDQVNSTGAFADGWFHLVALMVRSAVLELWIDGVKVAQAAVSNANLGQTNTSAKLRIGLHQNGTAPCNAATVIALGRSAAYAPTAEQMKHIFETEKAMFQASAQCCLAGTSNTITALAYDDETDLLHVGTSYGRSAFRGLVRASSEATPIGSIVALAAGAGVVAQIGASGTDVYVPAYSLREELLRDAEQMAKFGQNLVAHDFTATASQTTFILPVGWEIVAVYQQGALKRETTSWTRSFDGFVWSAVLGTGATVSDWISILAKRV